MRLPSHINILEQVWTVKECDLSEDYGRIDPHLREIQITRDIPPSALGETFLHELLHAIVDITHPPWLRGKDEESFVASFSPILYAVLVRNNLGLQDLATQSRPATRERRKAKAGKTRGARPKKKRRH